MADQVADDVTEATQPDEATDETEQVEAVAEQAGSDEDNVIATWRKRQAGADAARARAEQERDELRKRLAAYEAKDREAQNADLSETAKLQAALEAEKRRADEAEVRANARVLDSLYPNARKKVPEVTDEVRLAELEALLSEPKEIEGQPRGMRAPKDASAPATARRAETSQDILARLKATPFS